MLPHLIVWKADWEEVIMRLLRWLVMVLSFSAVYTAVAMVTGFRVLEAHFGEHEEDRENLHSSDNRTRKLLKYSLLGPYILTCRYIHDLVYTVFGLCRVCLVPMQAHPAGVSSWVWNDHHFREIMHQPSWSHTPGKWINIHATGSTFWSCSLITLALIPRLPY